MHKNGFIFLESLIVIVTLISTLLLLYHSFKRITNNVKQKENYDEVNYIYRSEYLKENLQKYILDDFLKDQDYLEINNESVYLNNDYLKQLYKDFEIADLIIVKKESLNNLQKCLLNKSCLNINDSFKTYIASTQFNISSSLILISEYKTCLKDKCQYNYSWVGW